MHAPLSVSQGLRITFTANKITHTGIITESEFRDMWVDVTVMTDDPIVANAQLSIPDVACGGCGLATPMRKDGIIHVTLSIMPSCVNLSTLTKR